MRPKTPIKTFVSVNVHLPTAEAEFKIYGKVLKPLTDDEVETVIAGFRKALMDQNNKFKNE